MDGLDEATFKAVMGRFATGVTVVTTVGAAGYVGVTVNAFCSLSLAPPLVCVCLDALGQSCAAVEAAGRFAVSILSDRHEFLSERFAGRAPLVPPDFAGAPHRLSPAGLPVIEDCLAWLDCRVRAGHAAGDHLIVVGEVTALGLGVDEPPLLYWAGRYRRHGGPVA